MGARNNGWERVQIPVSPGELGDRLTILELKVERIRSPDRRAAAAGLLADYAAAWAEAGLPPLTTLPEGAALRVVNTALWEVEDELRGFETAGRFDQAFVAAARSVYRLNDERAALKAALDRRLGSHGTEPKEFGGPTSL